MEQLVRELIFEPLGMESAGFGVPWEGEAPTDPSGHTNGTEHQSLPARWQTIHPRSAPAGRSILRLATGRATSPTLDLRDCDGRAEHLRGAGGKNGLLLEADTYRRLHKGRRIGDSEDEYALGRMILRRPWAKGNRRNDYGRSLHHAGTNNSWFALVWIAPERDFAVLCATNIGGEGIFPKIDAVNWALIRDHLKTSTQFEYQR